MDRRLLLKGLFGVAGAGALAVILPPQAEALMGHPDDLAAGSNVLPNLEELKEAPDDGEAPVLGEGVEPASHRRRRRRRRRWRWRRHCRRYWWHGYYRRRCRRRRVFFWIWI
jgi:hypothetical protein